MLLIILSLSGCRKDTTYDTSNTIVDGDGDGVPVDEDCDDTNPAVFPGATEVCNGADDDCNGAVDDAVGGLWYQDLDEDGYGDPATGTQACEAEGLIADSSDCNDDDPAINVAADELCDGIDNDCDGDLDVDAVDAPDWYADADSDGYGDPEVVTRACDQPSNTVSNDEDCDDSDGELNPETIWYADGDIDGYGNAKVSVQSCEQPDGFVDDDTDCDDSEGSVWPDNPEICDGLDNDCDEEVDEGVLTSWYFDGDGDGYGEDDTEVEACDAPTSDYSADGGDCDDEDGDFHPNATPGCDGSDYDCDGSVDNDGDGDGYADVSCGGDDCDDTTQSVGPCTSCNDYYSYGSTTDGIYTIDPGNTGSTYDVYCDMTTDDGGWTLAFTATADDTTYGSGWDYWWTAGGTATITTTTDTGKSQAYDDVTFGEFRLTASSGSSTVIASTGTTTTGVYSLLGGEITTCSGLDGTPRQSYTSSSRTGTYWQNDYIALVACDTDGADLEESGGHYDAAIFTTNLTQGDYNYTDGDLGSEFRLGGVNGDATSSSSNRLSVWLR